MAKKSDPRVPPSFEKTAARQMIDPQEIRAVALGMDVKRAQSLLFAVLDNCGGTVTLSKGESERVWNDSEIHFERTPDGGLKLALIPYSPTEPRH